MKQYKIAFYIQLKNTKKSLQGADLDIGNPGVGGTQYLFLLTVKYLNKLYGGSYALLLTDGEFGLEDADIPVGFAADEACAVRYCEKNAIDALTFNANVADRVAPEVFETSVRIFLWAHNTLSWKRQLVAAKTKSIDRVVCVSESQYKNMQDTPCFEKCTFINNVIPERFYNNSSLTDYSEPKAVYVGSVMPQKGVHNLLEIWRYVEKSVPNAQLYVFGGANVWNPEAELECNVAGDKYYDRIIRKRLNKLKYPQNIRFMGARGWKEIDGMITTARVGIVNPSHYLRDETFCMSAIEMEAHGIPVVSRQRHDGLATTIQDNKTGFLEEKDEEIAARIVSLIKDDKLCRKMGSAARDSVKRFIVENEVRKWYDITEAGRKDIKPSEKLRKSNDSKLLNHDFWLKLGFLIESGKIVDLALEKIKRR